MVWIPPQTTILGSDEHYPEEGPAHEVTVDGFWIQTHQVTNAEFAEFVAATSYVTVAERPLDPADYPGRTTREPAAGLDGVHAHSRTGGPAAHQSVVGMDTRRVLEPPAWASLVVRKPRPITPSYTSPSRMPKPTRTWAGRPADRSRMGDRGPRRPRPGGLHLGRRTRSSRANGWPTTGTANSRGTRNRLRPTAPVGSFRPTATDCSTWRAMSGSGPPTGTPTRATSNRVAPRTATIRDQPQFQMPRKVIKGGSFLCADSYCLRYRPRGPRPQHG